MAIGLIGQKLGMTRLLSDDGSTSPVSVIQIEPNRIVQTKTIDIDGYNALQVTIGKKINKKGQAKVGRYSGALKGHYAKASQEIGSGLWEIRVDDAELSDLSVLDVSFFGAGHFVNVTGKSKGKGFQGGVKRHNFSMQDATHGNSLSHRALGSTGQCQTPGRVFKGKKMAGQMGNMQVTEECLEVLRVDNERNLLLVKGAIPGSKNGFVRVFLSDKKNNINEQISKQLSELKVAEAIETEAVETQVVETKAVETQDEETKAVETDVVETKAVETQDEETKAVETDVVETEAVETQDEETKAVETQDEETKDK